jgi:lipopolysaccharide exporter
MHDKQRHYWLKSGSFTIMQNMLGLLLGFGGFYMLVRVLDKHSFGIWALFVATTSIFEMSRNGLIQTALIKYLSESGKEDHAQILSASYFLNGVLMLVCILINLSIAGYLAYIWHYPGFVPMFYLYSLVYLIQGVLAQFQFVEQANLSFFGVFLTSTIRQGGFFLFVLFCFISKRQTSLINLIWVQALSALLALAVEFLFVRQFLYLSFDLQKVWVMKLLNYGKYVFGTSISSLFSNTINQMMLGAIKSTDAAGAYNIALRIASLADLPVNAVGTIVFPQSSKRFLTQGVNASKYLYEKSVGTILALLLPCLFLFFLFPTFFVHLIAGRNYPEAIPAVKITFLICLLSPYERMFGTILDSTGRPNLNFLVILLHTVCKLAMNYFLIQSYGIMGAVYGNCLADLLFFIVMQWILRRDYLVNVTNTFVYAVRFYPEFFQSYIKPQFKK